MTIRRLPVALAAGAARFGAVLIAVLAAAPSAAAQETPALGPGDVVRLTVFRQPELSGEFEVGEDGRLLHPLYREVQVAGVPAAEVDARLRQFLQRYEIEPRFLWEPMVRITVGGEVRRPMQETVKPSTTAFQAVVAAGGATDRARTNRVTLLRDGSSRTLDLSQGDTPEALLRVRSGDVLVVPRKPPGLRDWLGPVASVAAASAAILNLLRRR